MDIARILQSLKGKVLDLRDIELLKHAYDLQKENIRQLKTNNEALKENSAIAGQRVSELECRVAELERENQGLANHLRMISSQGGGKQPDTLEQIDVEILRLLSQRDGDYLPDPAVLAATGKPKTVVEYHLNQLEKDDYIFRMRGVGQGYARNCIADKGRKFLIDRGLV